MTARWLPRMWSNAKMETALVAMTDGIDQVVAFEVFDHPEAKVATHGDAKGQLTGPWLIGPEDECRAELARGGHDDFVIQASAGGHASHGGPMTGRFDQQRPAQSDATLFDPPPIEPMPILNTDPPGKRPASIQHAFERFDRKNPWVAIELRKMALELVRAGHTRIGMGMLFEVLRWRHLRSTIAPDTSSVFTLNNNYRSRYARMLMDDEPELAGKFETRKVRTA